MSKKKYIKKKFLFTKRHYRDEEVLDLDTGYATYEEVNTQEIFGVPLSKRVSKGKTVLPDSDNDDSMGFKHGSRQSTE